MEEAVNKPKKSIALVAKIIAIVIFALLFSTLTAAVVSDFVIFSEQIFAFILASLAAIIVFIFAFILMVLSIMLVFGVFLLENDGFWPAAWSENTFKQIINDHLLSDAQVQVFQTVRYVILGICIVVFVSSVVALILNHIAIKKDETSKSRLTKVFSILSLIFSILGIFAAIIMLLIISLI